MFNQHTEMRDQLQNRHEKMVRDVNGFTNCRVELQGLVTTRDPTGPSQKELLGQNDIDEGRKGDKSCMCIIFKEGCSSGRRRLAESEIIVNTMENHQGAMLMEELNASEEREINMENSFLAMRDRMVELQDSVDRIAERLDMEVIDPKMNEAKSKKSKKSKAIKDDGGGEEVPDEESLFNRNLHETGVGGEEKASGTDEVKRTVEAMELAIEVKLDSVEKKMDSVENKMTGIAMKDEVELIKGKVDKIEEKVDKIEKSMEELKDMLSKLVMGGGAAAV